MTKTKTSCRGGFQTLPRKNKKGGREGRPYVTTPFVFFFPIAHSLLPIAFFLLFLVTRYLSLVTIIRWTLLPFSISGV